MKSPVQLLLRATVLFLIGVFFSLVLHLLQVQRHFPHYHKELATVLMYSSWWLPIVCGAGSAVVGLAFPYLDHSLGEQQVCSQEWSNVMRCVAMFVGINHASVKIDFTSSLQLSIALTILSIALWWWFDRTRSGFGMGVGIAVLATCVTQLLIYNGVYKYTERDFLYIRSWLPCVVFSGGITIGNIGRQLAATSVSESRTKRHNE